MELFSSAAFFAVLFYACLVTLWKVVPDYWHDSDEAADALALPSSGLRYGKWIDTWTVSKLM